MPDNLVYSREQVTFAILSGGFSARMGKDKAFLPFMGELLIQRIIFLGQAITDNILVVTNRSEKFRFLQVPLTQDLLCIKSPLVGLYTALSVSNTENLILVGCDMPFINPILLSYQLHILEHEPVDIVTPKHANGVEPLHAVYKREPCLDLVKAALNQGERSLSGWHGRAKVREISGKSLRTFEPELMAFMNLNTPHDYQLAESYAQSRLTSD